MKKPFLTCFVLCIVATTANAAIINFDLKGKGGTGLLSGNENGAIAGTPGSGGEVGAGISFNDATLALTINIGWGSGNGFTNLSGTATGHHIHGPTASSGTASFTENAAVLIPLDSLGSPTPYNSSATNGGFNGAITLTATQATQLLDGRFYLNVHTGTNGGGEIRGNLVPVPEPATLLLMGLGAISLAARFKFTGQ